MKELNNKVVVITGAGGVLCSMFAKEVARRGGKVALLDLNYDMANKYAQEIVSLGDIAKAYRANALDRQGMEQVHQQILNDFGKCDVLINGAGGNSPKATCDNEYFNDGDDKSGIKTFFDLDKEGFNFVFDLNLMGTVIPTQVFAVDMLGRVGCSILNISSMNAYRPLTKIPAYSAAKSAVGNFTQWCAVHFAKQGIRVNAIAPGFFVTNQNKALLFNADGTPTSRTAKILSATPMGRFGKEEELLGAVMFFIDDAKSGFITGVCLAIDGGFSAYSGV